MCGLVATFGPVPAEPADVELACRAIAHRGPDGQGTWTGRAGRLAADLGHRRLAILDPSPAGAQPMTIDGGSLAVSYNGELYNYPKLRTQLQSRGHRFRSRCDTEALLHGYREWGLQLAAHLEGMFAFVLVDQRAGTVLAARDRLGVKPLYWSRTSKRISFASEPKALFFLDRDLPVAADPLATAAVLTLLWVPHPRSSFLGVEKVAPGHQVVLQDGQVRVERYWDLVAAWSRDFASRVSPAEHAELLLAGEHWKDAADLIWHLDDLVADPAALSMRLMAEAARPKAKVLLSGVGAEELLAGYPRYLALGSIGRLQAAPRGVRRMLAAATRALPASRPGPLLPVRRNAGKYAEVLAQPPGWFRFFSYHDERRLASLVGNAGLAAELFGWMCAREERVAGLPPRERATLTDLCDFLPNLNLSYVDKASMAEGVEVRVPLIDERMVAAAARLPDPLFVARGVNKRGLKLAAEPYLPKEFIYRKKAGLGGPVRFWVAASMGDALDARVEDLAGRGWVDQAAARALVAEHRRGQADRALACWAMFSLSLWAERFLDVPRDRWLG